jgi:hypothetical protein
VTQKGKFAGAVTGLLKHLNMEAPPGTVLSNEIYTISTGHIDIELTGSEDGRITLFCFPGTLPKLHLESLATLLLANRYQQAHPPILTSLVGQTVPPKVLLWSSLAQAEADANDSALSELFIRMAEAADDMRSWIEGGLAASQGKQPKSVHIEWLRSQAGSRQMNRRRP